MVSETSAFMRLFVIPFLISTDPRGFTTFLLKMIRLMQGHKKPLNSSMQFSMPSDGKLENLADCNRFLVGPMISFTIKRA
jgi:hypothetical protein